MGQPLLPRPPEDGPPRAVAPKPTKDGLYYELPVRLGSGARGVVTIQTFDWKDDPLVSIDWITTKRRDER